MREVRRTVQAPADMGNEVISLPEGSDVDLDLRMESVLEGVLVTGVLTGRAVGECARCLDEVEQDVKVSFTELYAYPDRESGEEDDVRELQDELIDLEPALRDAVVPALPFRPLCREDCPGLCPQCGARLADEPDHAHEQLDPRWQALAGLLDQPGSEN